MPTMWLSDSQSKSTRQISEISPATTFSTSTHVAIADVYVCTQKSELPSAQVVGRVSEFASVFTQVV